MYNPLEDFEPQTRLRICKIKNPLDLEEEQDGENTPVFKGFKNPFEQDEE